jgi:hypothetical protein
MLVETGASKFLISHLIRGLFSVVVFGKTIAAGAGHLPHTFSLFFSFYSFILFPVT